MTNPPELLTDRDAVAAVLAAHKVVHRSIQGPNTTCSGCDWQTYVPFGSSAVAAHDAHLADALAPLLAQARAEAVAAALAPVERLADDFQRLTIPGTTAWDFGDLIRAAVAEGKEASRG